MKTINVTTKEQLDALYNESALTWEGLSVTEENLKDVVSWLTENGALLDGVEPTFNIIKGKTMNSQYGLTGNNAYPDDLNIVSVTGIDLASVVIPRFQVGGRWFNDIVDNNRMREQ